MVTATLASQRATSLIPLWLGRLHSWWFIAQVVANLAAATFIIRLIRDNGSYTEMGLGMLLGQGFLLSVWLALGGLPNVARFVAVSLVTLTGGLMVSDYQKATTDWGNWVFEAGQIFIICLFMVLLFHGLILPLRWLLGWRLDFDPAYHARETTCRMQIGVTHILGWTTFLAIPCALFRLFPTEDFAEVGVICLTASAMTLPIAATFTLAAVSRRIWLWSLLAAAMFGITLAAESYIPDLVIDRNFLQFNLGIAGAVAGNLLVLRLLGLKLFSVVQQGAPSSADRENPVKPPHFQFQPAARQETGAAGS